MQSANDFLEQEYWPEWNAKFARQPAGEQDLHRPLTEGFELGSTLSHVEQRIITNNYTFPYYSKHYQIVREDVEAGMRRQQLRVELWLNGELKARYQGRYVGIYECGVKPPEPPKTKARKEVRKDHNAGGKSHWMDGFFDQPSPPLWKFDRSVSWGRALRPGLPTRQVMGLRRWREDKVRPIPGNSPHDRPVSRGISSSLKESLRRSLPHHRIPQESRVRNHTGCPVCVFQGMAESIWSDGLNFKSKDQSQNQILGRDQPPPAGRPRAQAKERAGRIALFLIVRR